MMLSLCHVCLPHADTDASMCLCGTNHKSTVTRRHLMMPVDRRLEGRAEMLMLHLQVLLVCLGGSPQALSRPLPLLLLLLLREGLRVQAMTVEPMLLSRLLLRLLRFAVR